MCNPHVSTLPPKPGLLSIAEGLTHKYILSSQVYGSFSWPFHVSVPEKQRNLFMFLMWHLSFYMVFAKKMGTLNILNEQRNKRNLNIHGSETTMETLRLASCFFENGSSHQRHWSIFPVLVQWNPP